TGWATAISAGPPDEASSQTLTFVVTGNSNPGLFSAGPAISAAGTLSYTPATNANGSASITLVLQDSGGGPNTTVPQSFTITVNTVNDAPSFTKGPDVEAPKDGLAQTVSAWATNILRGPPDEVGQSLNFEVNNDNTGLFSAQPAIAPDGTLTF